MNQHSIFSLPWADPATAVEFRRVKAVAGGVALAGAADKSIGTSLDGDLNVEQANIQGKAIGIHYATVGNDTALATGNEIEGAADGKVVKKTTGTAIGVVVDLNPNDGAPADGDLVRVVYY